MTRWLAILALVLLAAGASAETIVRPDTTTGVIVAAGDSLYALPAATARLFDLNDLPDIETTLTANDTINIGDAYKCEAYTFGVAPAGGCYFRLYTLGNTRYVTGYFFIGGADSIRVNVWQY